MTDTGNENIRTGEVGHSDPKIASLEEEIRRKAEQQILAVRTVADQHKKLIAAREEFAKLDRANSDALASAIADARAAGFPEKDLSKWESDIAGRKARPRRSGSSRRKSASAPATLDKAV